MKWISNIIPRLSYNEILFVLIFPFLLLLPNIRILGSLAIGFTDLLLPFIIITIIIKQWYRHDNLKATCIAGGAIAYILFSMLINKQIGYYRNYFDIFRVFKIYCYYLFIKNQFDIKIFSRTIDAVFVALVIFNIFHFFNIFNFNEIVMPVYCGEDNIQLAYFGHYSDGSPGPKRMIGTMLNPNHNAILFLFFLILYSPKREWPLKEKIFSFIALVLMILCQSRTALIAFVILLIANFIIKRIPIKKVIIQTVVSISTILLIINADFILKGTEWRIDDNDKAMSYAGKLMGNDIVESQSVKGRIAMWKSMYEDIKDRPVFGHSPDKKYFDNKHPDNEYIAIAYKYGIIGLIAYMLLYIIPFFVSCKSHKAGTNSYSPNMILIVILFAMVAITNEPMYNIYDQFFYITIMAIFYKFHKTEKERNGIEDKQAENTI
jgi:O-antigen ligase